MISFFLLIVLAFLAGSIPTAFLAGKITRGIDIRQHGSGNSGATNAFRVLGQKIGTLVFLIDFLKGFLPVFFLSRFASWTGMDIKEIGLLVGLAAILGHVFTPFLGFKGGKGIATGGGVLCGVFPLLFLIVFVSWVFVFSFTRIVSISSLLSMAVLVAASFILRVGPKITLFFTCMFLFTVWTHRANISRLLKGTENKIS